MTFHTDIYKMIETKESQIYRFAANQFAPIPQKMNKKEQPIKFDLQCNRCGQITKIQANIGRKQPLQTGFIEFPKNNQLKCHNCQAIMELSDLRRQLEAQARQKVV